MLNQSVQNGFVQELNAAVFAQRLVLIILFRDFFHRQNRAKIDNRGILNLIFMNFSLTFYSINSASSVFTLITPKQKRYTLNTRMMHLNANKREKCGMLDTARSQLCRDYVRNGERLSNSNY